MSFNLDLATSEQLLSIPGVGSASLVTILEHLEKRGGFTTLAQLTECAPQLRVSAFEQMHRDGVITSSITEYKGLSPHSNSELDREEAATKLDDGEAIDRANEQKKVNPSAISIDDPKKEVDPSAVSVDEAQKEVDPSVSQEADGAVALKKGAQIFPAAIFVIFGQKF